MMPNDDYIPPVSIRDIDTAMHSEDVQWATFIVPADWHVRMLVYAPLRRAAWRRALLEATSRFRQDAYRQALVWEIDQEGAHIRNDEALPACVVTLYRVL